MTFMGRKQGRCLKCDRRFIGPGDRCPSHQQELRQRRKRKPR
jgi:hypothetical protein